jgi:hypothetical protein
MIGTFGEPRLLDTPFYLSQLATMIVWLLAWGTIRWQRRLRWFHAVAIGMAIVTEVVLPAAWSVADLPRGLDIVQVFPAIIGTIVESVLSCLWAVTAAADAVVARGPVVRPFVATAGISLALWILWTLWLLSGG